MHRHKPLEEEVKSAGDFAGLVNTRRVKDFGQKALQVATNVEITDTKKIVRRNGYTLTASGGAYTAIYGTDAQNHKYAVKSGALVDIDRNDVETQLTTGLLGKTFSWDEDPNNNVFFCSEAGSSGIITNDGAFLPLSLPVPVISAAGVVDPGTWEFKPFALGKKYSDSPDVRMQVMATYVMADGRESAPSETVSIAIAPEVRLIRVIVPTAGVATRVYATAPGGSTYYLVAVSTLGTTTMLVKNLNMTATGQKYPYTSVLESFPTDARLLCHTRHGRLMAACYDPAADMGVVYLSLPQQYHLFNKAKDFISVSSCPLLLLPHAGGIIIGTSTNIYNYVPAAHHKDTGVETPESLTEIANYGVVPGICGDVDKDGTPYFWTARGIAKAMPFELVTQEHFYGDPGVYNTAKIIYERGYAKLVASTVSGAATFNQWSER